MTVLDERKGTWSAAARADTETRARDGVIDTMRGVAILMVIGIHALPKADGAVLVTAIDAVLRPCVPIFLFASGYLTARAGAVPLGKRLRRTLEPYTIAFIGAYAFMAASNPAMDHRPAVAVARYVFAYVFVYYYVFVYVGCTLMLWGLMTIAGRARDGRLIVLLAMTLLAGLVVGAYLDPLLQRAGVSEALIEEVRLRDLPFWFSFVAAGALVGHLQAGDVLRELRYPLLGATILSYAIYVAIRVAGFGDAAAYDLMAFYLYAVLLCLALLGLRWDSPALAVLGSASYFIYLWHIFVIMALRPLPALQAHPLLATISEYAAALAVSAGLVLTLRRLAPRRLVQMVGA